MALDQQARILRILQTIDKAEKSPLTIDRYFKVNKTPFSRAQYYIYKDILKTKGKEGLLDQRAEGNNKKFTNEIQTYVKGMLQFNRSIPSSEVKDLIFNEFQTLISETVINDFRRENNLTLIRPVKDNDTWQKSGAAELIIALALKTGFIDTIAQFIYTFVQNIKETDEYKNSELIEKDLVELRSNGKFTAEYNKEEKVRTSKFNSIDEKIENKRFTSMKIFTLSLKTIKRYITALLSMPFVTDNGKVRNVNNPKGSALKTLCGFNYKMATLEKHITELKYLKISNDLIETTAKFWLNFWGQRDKKDDTFACYYVDGNTKALWSSKPCKKARVTMLGRVMNGLEQVFIHDGQGRPFYFQTFSGHADLGKNAFGMMEKVTEFLNETTGLDGQFTVNRILVMDAGGNAVKTLRAFSGSPYHYISILDSNQVTDRNIKHISEEKRYEYGDASLVDCKIELKDSNENRYLFETRAVQVNWDNGKTSVLVTSLSKELFSTDNVVKSYFDRWPFQELDFKDMKSGVNIHRIVGYGKKLVDNEKVLEKIEKLQDGIQKLENELSDELNEIRTIEKNLCPLIKDERIYRERSRIKDGIRNFLHEREEKEFKDVTKKIDSNNRRIKKIEGTKPQKFKLLKKKRNELARIIDKKKIYQVDVELDQIMTCFKISFANICCYLLEECFNGERKTLEYLFQVIFALGGQVKFEDNQRIVVIERNPKQADVMDKLQFALDTINGMNINDLKGMGYSFSLV